MLTLLRAIAAIAAFIIFVCVSVVMIVGVFFISVFNVPSGLWSDIPSSGSTLVVAMLIAVPQLILTQSIVWWYGQYQRWRRHFTEDRDDVTQSDQQSSLCAGNRIRYRHRHHDSGFLVRMVGGIGRLVSPGIMRNGLARCRVVLFIHREENDMSKPTWLRMVGAMFAAVFVIGGTGVLAWPVVESFDTENGPFVGWIVFVLILIGAGFSAGPIVAWWLKR